MARSGRAGPILTRLAVGQMAGLLLGMLAFALLPAFAPGVDPHVRWGLCLWHPTLGLVIALLDLVEESETLPVYLPWWVRGALAGAWMSLVAILLAFDAVTRVLSAWPGYHEFLSSPLWLMIPGGLAGLVIAYLVMRFSGAGREMSDD